MSIQPERLTPADAIRLIREIGEDSDRIVVLRHAQTRQRQRRITRRQIEACVRRGSIAEGPFLNSHGNWQVSLYRHAAGEAMTCVVAIDWPKRLLVITVF